jgi:hypothetical protein
MFLRRHTYLRAGARLLILLARVLDDVEPLQRCRKRYQTRVKRPCRLSECQSAG